MSNQAYKHWILEEGEKGISWLWLDKADSSVNVLSSDVLGEMEQIVAHLEQYPPKGLVIASKKDAGFLAGADIKEFTGLKTQDQVMDQLQCGQNLFLRVQRLKCTTVAAIHGQCMGGGTELALACDYRVADEAPDCKIGLPEVRLGIHPGYGGTVRLSRLIDDFQALVLMVGGRLVNGKTADKLGIVDVTTQRRHLYEVAEQIARGDLKPGRRTTLTSRLLAFKPLRRLAASIAARQLKKKVNPKHYPAPFQLVRLWRDLPSGDEPAYLAEAESVASLLGDPIARRAIENLVRVFLLERELKGRAKQQAFTGKHIHVVGAGVMGGEIAAWCALRGFRVSLQDAKAAYIAPAMARAYNLFKKRLKSEELVQAAMDRLTPDVTGGAVSQADLVIEAITENLEVKQTLYATLEPRMKKGALLASNTSSIPLEELSAKLTNPGRLVGIHFFNPVAMMQLVEVVRGKNTSDESVSEALALVNAIGKLPIEVKSAPGFLINRVLMSYLAEAMRLYSEGVPPAVIDREAVRFGMPMGPIELADVVGLDICKAVASKLIEALGGDSGDDEIGKVIDARVTAGKLGKKTGEGFYKWSKGKPKKATAGSGDVSPGVLDRMLFSMLNESMQCLAEGIVGDVESLDLGMIFGTGFPPFHGGPIQYIKSMGQAQCKDRLEELASLNGQRFMPQPGWAAIRLGQE